VWGTASLQRYGESTPYLSAALVALLTLALSVGYRAVDEDHTIATPAA
jgi:hypothetical protein